MPGNILFGKAVFYFPALCGCHFTLTRDPPSARGCALADIKFRNLSLLVQALVMHFEAICSAILACRVSVEGSANALCFSDDGRSQYRAIVPEFGQAFGYIGVKISRRLLLQFP